MKNLKFTDKLDFGKYKGKTVKYVRGEDPEYLGWAVTNKIISFGDKIDKELKIIFQAQKLEDIAHSLSHEDWGDRDDGQDYDQFDGDPWNLN